jgi:hypothetical protein
MIHDTTRFPEMAISSNNSMIPRQTSVSLSRLTLCALHATSHFPGPPTLLCDNPSAIETP